MMLVRCNASRDHVTDPSSVPSGCGNWYVSCAPRSMSKSARRTKEQCCTLRDIAHADSAETGQSRPRKERIICGNRLGRWSKRRYHDGRISLADSEVALCSIQPIHSAVVLLST